MRESHPACAFITRGAGIVATGGLFTYICKGQTLIGSLKAGGVLALTRLARTPPEAVLVANEGNRHSADNRYSGDFLRHGPGYRYILVSEPFGALGNYPWGVFLAICAILSIPKLTEFRKNIP